MFGLLGLFGLLLVFEFEARVLLPLLLPLFTGEERLFDPVFCSCFAMFSLN